MLLSLTVKCGREIVTFGEDMVSPGSPLIPGIPGGPMSPLIPRLPGAPTSPLIPGIPGGPTSPLVPLSPCIPGGPTIPCVPFWPGGPMVPWEPFLPLLPGGPGIPCGQMLKPTGWQIFWKLEITTDSKNSFIFAELLNGRLLEILRLILWNLIVPFGSIFS